MARLEEALSTWEDYELAPRSGGHQEDVHDHNGVEEPEGEELLVPFRALLLGSMVQRFVHAG